MRRGASIAVLLVLLSGVLAPLAQGSASSVPACCRANGQHHCMGMPGMDGFRSLASKCPYHVAPAVTSSIAAVVSEALQVSVLTAESSSVSLPNPVAVSVAFGVVQKRGPPIS
jgi:hypothetical protein